jgi:hypothetical protein
MHQGQRYLRTQGLLTTASTLKKDFEINVLVSPLPPGTTPDGLSLLPVGHEMKGRIVTHFDRCPFPKPV